ncbi:PTS ascorbate transporter subunit IIC [Actinomadura madurae]|uniref:PTS ascorbate transporter subunit IIC n=1 Tax=Actinomadura madurae TaxID=1993 RepID=UPI0020D258C7|nr:PTS ascorbate transporter subunit IIC [Actinomadura madurae]MCP9947502.1 PTS ascorbate transporter subunit IIC [Actinomadura madurae]MCP9964270.1 PTS ascorbate transporter subunit IIC [Actinomadura madurae]
MDVIKDILTFLADNVFGQVPILIGLITLIGLILQRKRFEDVFAGALRATIGVVILFIGVEVFTGGLTSFQTVLASAMGTTPPTADKTLADFLTDQGGTVALVITVAFLLHVLVVRLFPAARYLYLTGHLMFWISTVTVASLVTIAPGADQLTLVLCGAGFVAAYWTVQPLWMRPLMRRVMPDDRFGFAHTSSLACLVTGYAARPLGSRERHDTEKLRLPRQLSFFKDVNVSTALIISVIMLIGVALADDGVVTKAAAEMDDKLSPWVWALLVGLRFAGGIAILLFGVRMFLGEIVPAFKGFSDRVIPGTRPALDAPTVFPVAPTAVMVGFVASTAVFLACLGVFAAAGWFTLAPPMIMLFFVGGAAALFGNVVARLARRGARRCDHRADPRGRAGRHVGPVRTDRARAGHPRRPRLVRDRVAAEGRRPRRRGELGLARARRRAGRDGRHPAAPRPRREAPGRRVGRGARGRGPGPREGLTEPKPPDRTTTKEEPTWHWTGNWKSSRSAGSAWAPASCSR